MIHNPSRTTLSYAVGFISAVVGILVLIGWQFDIAILKSILPGDITMKANTGAAFLLAGLALIFLQRSGTAANILARFCGSVVLLIGLLSLAQHVFGWDIGFDEILFRDPEGAIGTSHPGLMPPNTALNFLLLGFAFFLLTVPRFRTSFLVESALIFSFSISIFGLVGYGTGLVEAIGPSAYTHMAGNTAGPFIILNSGMLLTAYEQQRTSITIEQKLFAGLTIASAGITFISLLSVSDITSLVQASGWVQQTQQAKNQIGRVLAHVLEVQSGERGFLLTGEDKYLAASEVASRELPALVDSLQFQTADNPRQQELIASLANLVEERDAFSDRVVSKTRTKGAEARALFDTERGKLLTDSIRVLVVRMLAEEDRLLLTRHEDETHHANRIQLIIYLSLVVQLLLLAFIFVMVNREVTGRRKAEEKTRQTKDLLDSIVENIPAMIFLKDAKDLRFVRFNKAGEELIGSSREELMGKDDYDFFPKDQADFFTAKDREVLAGNSVVDIPEESIQTKHKGQRILHTRKFSLRNDQGKAEYLLGISEDITERKRAEEMLREKSEELDRYFTQSLDLLCIADMDGNFRRLNKAWESTLGYTMHDLEGKSFLDFVHPDDIEATLAAMADLSKGKEVINFTNRYRCNDGSYRWIEWRSVPAGNLIYAVARDITDRKKAEETILHSKTQLEASNEELEAFSYSVSHDLRAPLRHIDGFVELLQKHADTQLDYKSRRYLNTISASAKQMAVLIDELLVFSRMGRTEMRSATVNLGPFLKAVLVEFEDEIAHRNIDWHISPLPEVLGDPSMLRLVFINLLSNAVKYTRGCNQAQIEIGYLPQRDEHVFFVRDNGVGFDMEYVNKLFGVFQRLHTNSDFEGTGIGLANVRRIISRHGGRTWAEGEIDKGATFYFSLPTSSTENNNIIKDKP